MREKILSVLGVLALAGCATQSVPEAPSPRAELAPVAAPPMADAAIWPSGAPPISARHAIMIDAQSGRTLFQKFADSPVQVASTQKLLTALLVVDRGDLDGRVVIAREDTQVEPGKLYVRPGQSYSRLTLLSAMMVKSENDAAAALARDHSGSMAAFADAMNRKAWSIGARNSRFVNSHGLPGPQHSSARDMARVAFRAYREPVLRRMMNTQYYTFVFADGRTKTLETTNKLLKRSSIFNGMKTGYTFAAGRCLISSATFNGRDVILVQFGSKTSCIFDDAAKMMGWGLSH